MGTSFSGGSRTEAVAVAIVVIGAVACSTTPTFVQDTGGAAAGGQPGSTGVLVGAGAGSHGATTAASAGGATASSAGTSTAGTTAASTAAAGTTTAGTTAAGTTAASTAASSGCTMKTCMEVGAACGTASDGCSGTQSCGACASPDTCVNNQCACQPTTCTALGKDCGTVSDGCGSMLYCGSCDQGDACGAGGTPNVCAVGMATECGTACPVGMTPIYVAQSNLVCGATENCGMPGAETVCVVSGLASQAVGGCNMNCAASYAVMAVLTDCNCAGDPGFYDLCMPN